MAVLIAIGPISSYDDTKVVNIPNGATALRKGAICKNSSGTMVPIVATNKQGQFWVALGDVAANATNGAFVPLSAVKLRIPYSGTPALLTPYGVVDAYTLDAADTSNPLLTVVKLQGDLDPGFVEAVEYQLSA